MKLNIITGFLFALLLSAGINTKATAQDCCRWHYYHSCCGHMDSKDKDKDKDEMTDKDGDKDKDRDCCHHRCGGCCHSWPYVAPKHCCHTECKHECRHECYHHRGCCGDGYYYRGGGR